ncbi:MAG: helix-turn-helix transcriptional regulator [Oscillospiraceae bacterium]|nr:helix-turn-helix transcriptional regulator [Oscillospiraceae bacterium]
MTFARIKAYMQENGIKQSWLAKQINMSPSQLSEVLSGKRPLYADDLAKICESLHVSSDTFLFPESA